MVTEESDKESSIKEILSNSFEIEVILTRAKKQFRDNISLIN